MGPLTDGNIPVWAHDFSGHSAVKRRLRKVPISFLVSLGDSLGGQLCQYEGQVIKKEGGGGGGGKYGKCVKY